MPKPRPSRLPGTTFADLEPESQTLTLHNLSRMLVPRPSSDGKTKYAAAPGLPELRQALADQYHQHGVIAEANPAQIVVSPGGKYSCYLAILATCGPGDEVLIPAPYWVSYPEMAKLAGATPKNCFGRG